MRNTNKVDRRVIKTKKQLRYALAMLLREKTIDQIKVSELTAYVDINRGTFYQHYKDVDDLLQQIEDEIYTDYENVINQSEAEFIQTVTTKEQLRELNLRYINMLLIYIKENSEIFISLFGKNGDEAFARRIKGLIASRWLEKTAKTAPNPNSIYYSYVIEFVSSGIIEVLRLWINKGMIEPTEEMTALILNISMKGMLETVNG